MKTFPQLLAACLLLISSSTLFSQSSPSKPQLGVAVSALLSNTSATAWRLGAGTEGTLWWRKRRNAKNSMQLSLTYRRQSGYENKSIVAEVNNFPYENEVLMRTKEVTALHYLDVGFHWQKRIRERWSYRFGLRGSFLPFWSGRQQETIWASYSSSPVRDNGFGTGYNGNLESNIKDHRRARLAGNNFHRFDVGVQAQLVYVLLPGLEMTMGLSQGLLPVFQRRFSPQLTDYRISALSLGLSSRLF